MRKKKITQQQKQTQWPPKRGRLQQSEDTNNGTTEPCGACACTAAVRGISLTKVLLKTALRVSFSLQTKIIQKKNERSSLQVDKVLGAASQRANSRHLTLFEWCDYVWSGAWQVAAPL